jgi:hypothetical protein
METKKWEYCPSRGWFVFYDGTSYLNMAGELSQCGSYDEREKRYYDSSDCDHLEAPFIEQFAQEQQELILSCLPEERKPDIGTDQDSAINAGHNDCRESFLQNLREVTDKSDEVS